MDLKQGLEVQGFFFAYLGASTTAMPPASGLAAVSVMMLSLGDFRCGGRGLLGRFCRGLPLPRPPSFSLRRGPLFREAG